MPRPIGINGHHVANISRTATAGNTPRLASRKSMPTAISAIGSSRIRVPPALVMPATVTMAPLDSELAIKHRLLLGI